ncbi:MAG: HEAT repeat domain-containing protein [Microcoleus sp.]
MVIPHKPQLHLASGLKLLLVACLIFLLNINPVFAQPIPRYQIPSLIEQLTDTDFQVRHEANDTLVSLGANAVPALCQALNSENRQLRWRAAAAIASIGSDAAAAVPNLTRTLQDNDAYVRRIAAYALGKIGQPATTAVPDLMLLLADSDTNLRRSSASALGQIGSPAAAAIPGLIARLHDSDASVRSNSARALGKIGSNAKLAVPALISLLQDPETAVRVASATALGELGLEAKAAVPSLKVALQDSSQSVRTQAADALGKIGADAFDAIPALIQALQDDNLAVRENAVRGLGGIAVVFQDKANVLSAEELAQRIEALQPALALAEDPQTALPPEYIAIIRRPLLALQAERDSRIFDRIWAWIVQHKWWLLVLLYPLVMPSIWWMLLRLRPLWLLRLNDALKPYTDIPVPMLGISVPIRTVLFLVFFHYRPRVLDAWVAKYVGAARKEFESKDTVRDRLLYVPVAIVKDGATLPQLTPDDLRPTFAKQRSCLLIWGEGGAGKTTTACQIARWAMADEPENRLCSQQMLPVLLEEDVRLVEGKSPLLEAIRGQLQYLIDEAEPIAEELLVRLLRSRRILVIIDRFSELNAATRDALQLTAPDFPINALVVTSRQEESLDKVSKTAIAPLRIEGNRLSSFMEAYLTQRGKRDLFTDAQFFADCSRLSDLVGQRQITVLLAKLYAEHIIAIASGITANDFPENIPDLMLTYLNELNRGGGEDRADDRAIQQDAKAIAWECVKIQYRSGIADRQDILAVLDNDESRLKYLEQRLHLIQAIGAGKEKIRFSLEPLAEYLAAFYLLENYGQDKAKWRRFFRAIDLFAIEEVKGFLCSLRDCCQAKGSALDTTPFVLSEIEQRLNV